MRKMAHFKGIYQRQASCQIITRSSAVARGPPLLRAWAFWKICKPWGFNHLRWGYNEWCSGNLLHSYWTWPLIVDLEGLSAIFFFAAGFGFFLGVPGYMLSCFSDFLLFCFSAFLLLCFSASLLFCFSAFLLLCFSASLLFCFSAFLLLCFSASLLFLLLCFSASLLFAFPASLLFLLFCFLLFLLLCFSASLFSLLLCFCTSVPFYSYYSTCSFLQSCVFAALLPAPLLLCFLSLLSFCFSFSFALLCSVCLLNETLERP